MTHDTFAASPRRVLAKTGASGPAGGSGSTGETTDVHLRGRPRPAVFVVLEGGLVEGNDFGGGSGPIRPVGGAVEALATLQREGRALVVVANQSGLALGRFSRSQFSGREALLRHAMRSAGVDLGPFVICPHMPGVDGRSICLCRLPAPGLLVRAARAGGLDLPASWIVGNDAHDLEAGRRAGCRSALLESLTQSAVQDTAAPRVAPPTWLPHFSPPDRRCTGWNEVVQVVLTERHRVPALP